MPAPAVSPEFATDATFAAGADPWSGDANKVDPSAPVRAEGFEPTILPAQWLNYMINNHGAWLKWLNDEVLASGARTLRIGAFSGDGGDATGAAPAFKYEVFSTGGTQGFHLVSASNFAARHLPISDLIPDGADLTGLRVFVSPGAARGPGDRMLLSVRTMALNWTTPAAPSFVAIPASLVEDDGTTAYQTIATGLLSITNDRSDQQIFARIQCGNDAGTNEDRIIGWEISYTGPKLR